MPCVHAAGISRQPPPWPSTHVTLRQRKDQKKAPPKLPSCRISWGLLFGVKSGKSTKCSVLSGFRTGDGPLPSHFQPTVGNLALEGSGDVAACRSSVSLAKSESVCGTWTVIRLVRFVAAVGQGDERYTNTALSRLEDAHSRPCRYAHGFQTAAKALCKTDREAVFKVQAAPMAVPAPAEPQQL